MALKNYKPTSPARRGLILVDKSGLHKGGPVKSLTEGKRKTGGRNNKGHVTSRGMAGGHKQKYRYVDFKRRKWDVEGTVERLEYCLLYTSPSPRDRQKSRMPSSA